MSTPTTPNFEAALERLQGIVKRMESGELSLEDGLKQFEEGVKLTRECQVYLQGAEQKIEQLLKAPTEGPDGTTSGKVETKPFTP